jgi:hypothetical protein
LNNEFMHEQAGRFAERLLRERAEDGARIDRAFALLLGREPTRSERERSMQFLEQARVKVRPVKAAKDDDPEKRVWTSFAGVMLRINEFLYVD